ncbi:MAG: hypothetical protein NT006_03720 [Candidatus Aminicenantes bacterium]|nr:hypothetical protein [Candidatus Aminicenantes bacterium]
MVSADSLKDILCQPKLKKTQKLLICLAVDVDHPKSIAEIKKLALSGGLNSVQRDKNLSLYLTRASLYAARTPEGWSLTLPGKMYVEGLVKPFIKRPVAKVTTNLRIHLAKISDPDTMAFIEEAIACCEAGFWRAAVVLSWEGAVSVLYDHVMLHKLANFNTEAHRNDAKWKTAKTKDHLARMKESDFLITLQGIAVLDKNVRMELGHCLELRNGCGHPSSLQIGEHRTAAHLEMLILNVFAKFVAQKETSDFFATALADWDEFIAGMEENRKRGLLGFF